MQSFQNEILDHLRFDNERNNFIEDLAKVHGELLFIHPFREGNGRTARLLANLMAFKANYDRLKFEKLDSEIMMNKYIVAVQKAGNQDYNPMKEIIALVL